MPAQEKFWIVALALACFYATHILLPLQLEIEILHLPVFALSQRPALDALTIVFGVSFFSAKWRVANWKEMLAGITVGLVYDPLTSPRHPGELISELFNTLEAPAALSLINVAVAPVIIATIAGFWVFNWAEKLLAKIGLRL